MQLIDRNKRGIQWAARITYFTNFRKIFRQYPPSQKSSQIYLQRSLKMIKHFMGFLKMNQATGTNR